MPTIAWKNGEINYTDEGRGTTVVLIHGFCESLSLWDDWQEDLVDEDLRIIRVDLPGFGASTATADNMDDYAASVNAVIKKVKIKRGILIGHSMGGYVTLALAATQPTWLIGVGLFHSHPYADNE
jgi:pimeloyl-ACP methyl ester carboxylesterase